MRPINRTLTMLVFDRIEMSVIEMANPRGHRDVPTLHSYMTVSCAVRKFEEDQKNVVTLGRLCPRALIISWPRFLLALHPALYPSRTSGENVAWSTRAFRARVSQDRLGPGRHGDDLRRIWTVNNARRECAARV
ncbi:MAG: hypothetical protein IPP36_10245 [Nitrosomonadales bacterium]|nr:hypothetical protein [Nitrosomonadales bacterium]